MAEQNLAQLNQQLSKNPTAGAASGPVFLEPVLEFDKIKIQNARLAPQQSVDSWFKPGGNDSNILCSNTDPQMIMEFRFREQVEVTTILLRADKGSTAKVFPPREIWFLHNQNHELDFNDLEDICDMDDEQKDVGKYGFVIEDAAVFAKGDLTLSLPPGRFKGCTKLTVFIKTNQDEDEDPDNLTFLNNLRFVGVPTGNKGIDKWEPCKS